MDTNILVLSLIGVLLVFRALDPLVMRVLGRGK